MLVYLRTDPPRQLAARPLTPAFLSTRPAWAWAWAWAWAQHDRRTTPASSSLAVVESVPGCRPTTRSAPATPRSSALVVTLWWSPTMRDGKTDIYRNNETRGSSISATAAHPPRVGCASSSTATPWTPAPSAKRATTAGTYPDSWRTGGVRSPASRTSSTQSAKCRSPMSTRRYSCPPTTPTPGRSRSPTTGAVRRRARLVSPPRACEPDPSRSRRQRPTTQSPPTPASPDTGPHSRSHLASGVDRPPNSPALGAA